MAKFTKLNTDIISRLFDEMKAALLETEEKKALEGSDNTDYIVGMSKVAGLAAGIMQESSLLIADVQALIRTSQMPSLPEDKKSFLGGLFKGGGSGGNTN